MDAFFASVEQRDNPQYMGKPLVVGGSADRGVIAAASYEARKYGVRSAMPSKIARRKCPFLIFVKPNFEAYKAVSKQIMEIFFRFTDLVEPLSIDEAFLDVTENKLNIPSATIIAKKIKEIIKEETDLTASAGVSYNKFLAKIASDYNKPDGFYLIKPEDATEFIENLPIEKFFGVGKVTLKKMHNLRIFKGIDLKAQSKQFLFSKFGKSGLYYYDIARGIDNRVVNPDRTRKLIGAENTFHEDIFTADEINDKIEEIAEKLLERCKRGQSFGKTLTLKVKFSDFKQITRSKTVDYKLDNYNKIINLAKELTLLVDFSYNSIRLIGLQISKLDNVDLFLPIQLQFDF